MAVVRPLTGLRYDPARVGDMGLVLQMQAAQMQAAAGAGKG